MKMIELDVKDGNYKGFGKLNNTDLKQKIFLNKNKENDNKSNCVI